MNYIVLRQFQDKSTILSPLFKGNGYQMVSGFCSFLSDFIVPDYKVKTDPKNAFPTADPEKNIPHCNWNKPDCHEIN
ncbi:MAG: hypothetical protein K8R21_06365, partial [Leptospira sp.]|nr:hypothetical protein [Leptospira sp.]